MLQTSTLNATSSQTREPHPLLWSRKPGPAKVMARTLTVNILTVDVGVLLQQLFRHSLSAISRVTLALMALLWKRNHSVRTALVGSWKSAALQAQLWPTHPRLLPPPSSSRRCLPLSPARPKSVHPQIPTRWVQQPKPRVLAIALPAPHHVRRVKPARRSR